MTRTRFPFLATALGLVLSVSLAVVSAQGPVRSRKPAPPGPLPPLPFVAHPAPRPPQVVQAVYEFAARHPEVLQHVPCFCGCERNGHVGNDDCFIKSRDANGRPTWDMHGYG